MSKMKNRNVSVIGFLNPKDLRTSTGHDISERLEVMLLSFNFLSVFLSSAETCQRILSPPCHGSSSNTSNSSSCKSSCLIWSLSLCRWLSFVFYYGNLSLLSVHYTIYYNTNWFHCIPFIIPAFVVQNLSFVWAHVKDSTYRQYGFTVIAAVICWLN